MLRSGVGLMPLLTLADTSRQQTRVGQSHVPVVSFLISVRGSSLVTEADRKWDLCFSDSKGSAATEVVEVYQDNPAELQLSQIVSEHCEKQREAPYRNIEAFGERCEDLSLMYFSPTIQTWCLLYLFSLMGKWLMLVPNCSPPTRTDRIFLCRAADFRTKNTCGAQTHV